MQRGELSMSENKLVELCKECEECCNLTACDSEFCTKILGCECVCCQWFDEEFDGEEEYEDDKEFLKKVVYNVCC